MAKKTVQRPMRERLARVPVKTHGGESLKRERAAKLTGTERRLRAERRAAEGAVAMAEHEEREKAKRANMERLKAERLARGGL